MYEWIWAVLLAQGVVKGADFACPLTATTSSGSYSSTTSTTQCLYSCLICLDPRPYNGSGVSYVNDTWGTAGTEIVWSLASPDYSDGVETPNTSGLQSARNITQSLYLNARPKRSTVGASQALPYWMMLVYFDLVDFAESDEALFADCDDGVVDEQCPAACTEDGDVSIEFYRANHTTAEGQSYRVPINYATHALDLSFMYGTSEEASKLLRSSDDASLMNLTSNEMPWQLADGTWLLADQRVAEDLGTLALTTLLLREHNRKAALFRTEMENGTFSAYECYSATSADCTDWSDEELFEATRMWVISVFSHITIQEFLPSLIGQAPSSYWAANTANKTDVRVDALFAAVGSRWIWSALSPVLRLVDESWAAIAEYETIELKKATDLDVIPTILELYGVAPVVRGLIATPAREIDASITDQTSSFNRANATLDIQRARDLGVPTYNDAREAYNLSRATSYADISSDETTQALLKAMYKDSGGVDSVEALVGALAEDLATATLALTGYNSASSTYTSEYFIGSSASTVASSENVLQSDEAVSGNSTGDSVPSVGPLLRAILVDQFRRTYQGDALWHRHINVLEAAMDYTLAELLSDNLDPTEIYGNSTGDLPTASFYVPTWDISSTASSDLSVTLKTGVYTLAWQEPGDSSVELTLTIVGMGEEGYFALGFGETMRDDADIIFVKVETAADGSRTLTVEDRYTAANALPKYDSTIPGCEDNAPSSSDYTYSCTSTTCTVTFTRSLDTGDSKCDKTITTGSNNVIWSFNLNAYDLQHGYNDRGSKTIDFYTGDSTTTTSSNTKGFFALHGAVMLIAYGLAAPAAWLVARYMKHKAFWIDWHEALGMVTAQSSIPIAAAAMASTSTTQFATKHGKVGLTLFCLSAVQVATGLLRMVGIENRATKVLGDNYGRFHFWNARVHRWCGRIIVPMGLANLYLGLTLISPSDTTIFSSTGVDSSSSYNLNMNIFSPIRKYVYEAWVIFLMVVFTYLEYRRIRRKGDMKSKLTEQANKPSFTQEQFDDHVLQGSKWVIVHDMVIDIEDYMKVHPGGSKIIKECIGHDITKYLLGEQKVGKGVFAETVHKHSPAAYEAMFPSVVGYLQKHDMYTEDAKPGVGIAHTDSMSSASTASGGRGRGRALGPSFVQYEVVEKTKVKGPYRKSKRLAGSATAEGAASAAQEEKRSVYRFVLAPKEQTVRGDAVRVGFYQKFRVAREGKIIQRQYTPIASHVRPDGRTSYEYLIRLYPGGQMSQALRAAKVGTVLSVQGPFVLEGAGDEYEHIYMLAGGTGVTPMLQLTRYHVRSMLARRRRAAAEENAAADTFASVDRTDMDFKDPAASFDVAAPAAVATELEAASGSDLPPQNGMAPGSSVMLHARANARWKAAKTAVAQTKVTFAADVPALAEEKAPADGTALPNYTDSTDAKTSATVSLQPSTKGWGRFRGPAGMKRIVQQRERSSKANTGFAGVVSNLASRDIASAEQPGGSDLTELESNLLSADGGDPTAWEAFSPAKSLTLLWQTRSEKETFALTELRALNSLSKGTFSFEYFYKKDAANVGVDGDEPNLAVSSSGGAPSESTSNNSRPSRRAGSSFGKARAQITEDSMPSRRDRSGRRRSRKGSLTDGAARSSDSRSESEPEAGDADQSLSDAEPEDKAQRPEVGGSKPWPFFSRLWGRTVTAGISGAPQRRDMDRKGAASELQSDGYLAGASQLATMPELVHQETVATGHPPTNSEDFKKVAGDADALADIELGGVVAEPENARLPASTPVEPNAEDQPDSAEDASYPARRPSRRKSTAALATGTGGENCLPAVVGTHGSVDKAVLERMLAPLLEGVRWQSAKSLSWDGRASAGSKLPATLDAASGSETVPQQRPDNCIIVVSGPPRFTEGMLGALRSLGLPEKIILFLD